MSVEYPYIKNFFYGDRQVEKVYLNGKLVWARQRYGGFAESKTDGLVFFHQSIRDNIGGDSESHSQAFLDSHICKQHFTEGGAEFTFKQNGIINQLRLEYIKGTTESDVHDNAISRTAALSFMNGTKELNISLDTVLTIITGLTVSATGQSVSHCEDIARTILNSILYTLSGETESYSNTLLSHREINQINAQEESVIHAYLQAVIPGWIQSSFGESQHQFDQKANSMQVATVCAVSKAESLHYISDSSFYAVTPLQSIAFTWSETGATDIGLKVTNSLWARAKVENKNFNYVLKQDGSTLRLQNDTEFFTSSVASAFVTDVVHVYGDSKAIESSTKSKIKLQLAQYIATYILENTSALGMANQRKVSYQSGTGQSLFELSIKPNIWWLPIGDEVPLAEHQMEPEELMRDGNVLEIQQVYETEILSNGKALGVN